MNGMKKILALVCIAVLSASMFVPALAGTTYTAVAGTNTSFKKFLIMDTGDTVPTATFAFTVAPGAATNFGAPSAGSLEKWSYNGTDYDTQAEAEAAAVEGGGTASDVVYHPAVSAGSGTMAVLVGVGTPTVSSVTFGSSDTTYDSVQNGDIDVARNQANRTGTAGTDTVQLDAGEKYAVKTATIDFSSVSFDEPGIYRYIVSETASDTNSDMGIVQDSDTDRVLDVYVTDNGSGTLTVSKYVMHTDANNVVLATDYGSGDVATADAPLADKTDGFTNEYTSKDLEISKTVSGNQASRDKYFALTVTCASLNDEDTFVVSLADDNDANTNDGNADATSGTTRATISENRSKTNPTSVTGAQLKAGVTFYLQHNQKVVVRGLPVNATYYLMENAEDYKSSQTAGATNGTSGTPAVIGTVAGNDKLAHAGFTNTRDGLVPTGIIMSVLPYVAILLIGICAVVFAVINKKRKAEDK